MRGSGRLSLRVRWIIPCGGEQPRHDQSVGFAKGCALFLPGEAHTRIAAGGAEGVLASSEHEEFLARIRGDRTQGFFAAVFEDERDGFAEAREAFLTGSPLSVCARDLSAIGDVPGPVPFDDRRKLVVHGFILAAIGGAGKPSWEDEQGVIEAWRRIGRSRKTKPGCAGAIAREGSQIAGCGGWAATSREELPIIRAGGGLARRPD